MSDQRRSVFFWLIVLPSIVYVALLAFTTAQS
jgi:hypothetical protein